MRPSARHTFRHSAHGWNGALGVAVIAVLGMVASCAPPPPPMTPLTVARLSIDYAVLGGIEQIYVVGATEGDRIEVSAPGVATVGGTVDRLGSFVIRDLDQGRTYKVTNKTSGVVKDVRVLVATENPTESFYRATKMNEGLNYIPMRDGITLAATVRPPVGQSLADGPFPTVIEYSGYQIAAPAEPLGPKIGSILGLPEDPLAPAGSTDVGSLLVRLAGFATVSVQMRGSGCSGGEADLFDFPTRYDGYDAIETVATQNWVQHGKVGMVGISFSGLSQIAVASTRPPHLAAIVPFSFVGSLYDLGRPGGIFNNGFAQTWLQERLDNAKPAPDPGAQPYANYLVQTDKNCRDNQNLRLQTRNGVAMVKDNPLLDEIYEHRDFRPWMSEIEVPTFASLQFNDEETSAYAMLSAQRLLDANPRVWLNLSNGHHRDAVSPDTITQMMEFLDIYVGRRPPQPKLLTYLLNGVIFGEGSVDAPLTDILPPLSQLFDWPVREAQKKFEARPRVRVLLGLEKGMNEGRNSGEKWQFSANEFPVAGSSERTWYLGENGQLLDQPGVQADVSYDSDPAARPATSGIKDETKPDDAPIKEVIWTPIPEGDGLGFITDSLDENLVALGAAAASIRLSSSAKDTDLAVNISEVRPDGQEMLVATGVQRASVRNTDPAKSTPVKPTFTLNRRQYLNGSAVTVPVQILPMGHVFRAGSKIRVSVHAVGGDNEKWAYDSVDPAGGSTVNTVHLGGIAPSSLTMTLSNRTGFGPKLLKCPSAGQPCRTFAEAANGG